MSIDRKECFSYFNIVEPPGFLRASPSRNFEIQGPSRATINNNSPVANRRLPEVESPVFPGKRKEKKKNEKTDTQNPFRAFLHQLEYATSEIMNSIDWCLVVFFCCWHARLGLMSVLMMTTVEFWRQI